MASNPPTDDDGAVVDPVEFEEMVAATLKVDPEGITGQRSAKAKEAKNDEGDDARG